MSLIKAENLIVAIAAVPILRGPSLTGAKGELIGLIGPNGAGKSTLLKALVGIQPYEGIVSVCGENVAQLKPDERARHIVYLPQDPVIRWPVTGRRLVQLGRLPHLDPWRGPEAVDEQAIHQAMADTDTLDFADREVMSLSGGERARILLARAFATGAEVILADEPVAALDPYHQLHTMELLQDKARSGCCVIVVLQDLVLAGRFCDRLILMKQGAVVADGPPENVLTESHLKSVYNVAAIPVSREDDQAVLPWKRV